MTMIIITIYDNDHDHLMMLILLGGITGASGDCKDLMMIGKMSNLTDCDCDDEEDDDDDDDCGDDGGLVHWCKQSRETAALVQLQLHQNLNSTTSTLSPPSSPACFWCTKL